MASGEQSSGLAQIREGLAQIDKAIQQNSASAEQTASSMAEISVKTRGLQSTVNRFRLNSAIEMHDSSQHTCRILHIMTFNSQDRGQVISRMVVGQAWGKSKLLQ